MTANESTPDTASSNVMGVWCVAITCSLVKHGGFWYRDTHSRSLNQRLVTAPSEEVAKALAVAAELEHFSRQNWTTTLDLCVTRRIKDA